MIDDPIINLLLGMVPFFIWLIIYEYVRDRNKKDPPK